jgi:hypothetical protein
MNQMNILIFVPSYEMVIRNVRISEPQIEVIYETTVYWKSIIIYLYFRLYFSNKSTFLSNIFLKYTPK